MFGCNPLQKHTRGKENVIHGINGLSSSLRMFPECIGPWKRSCQVNEGSSAINTHVHTLPQVIY